MQYGMAEGARAHIVEEDILEEEDEEPAPKHRKVGTWAERMERRLLRSQILADINAGCGCGCIDKVNLEKVSRQRLARVNEGSQTANRAWLRGTLEASSSSSSSFGYSLNAGTVVAPRTSSTGATIRWWTWRCCTCTS